VKSFKILILMIFLALFMAACTATSQTSPTPENLPPTGLPTAGVTQTVVPEFSQGAGDAAIQALAVQIRIPEDEIRVVSIEEVQWPDSCLGAPAADEVCAAVITPGFRVILEAGEKSYEYRTNRDGSVVRPSPSSEAQNPATTVVRQILVQRMRMRLMW